MRCSDLSTQITLLVMSVRTKEEKLLVKVGQRIRDCRLRAGLRQEDVENFGVSWKHYQKIESGKTNTTLKILYNLATAFGCHPRDFLA